MTINCSGTLVDFDKPKVMGILNVTPDSFFDGGLYTNETVIIQKVEEMLLEGASFIDIGGYSSKPNASVISEEEEINRILPVLKLLVKKFPTTNFSVDTFRSNVAKIAIENGVCMINDIAAGGLDEKMFEVIAEYNVPYIMMHLIGTPQTMQDFAQYDNIAKEILFYFSKKIAIARNYGINDLIIDPGFGFSKNVEQNYELLEKLELFQVFELPILVGLSRKSMVYKALDTTPENALNGTTVLNTIALQKGANILRVHDVQEAVTCIKLIEKTFHS